MNNLVLIGFMGSGKSTVGRLLAAQTNRYFLDTDALIEAAAGKTIEQIFESEGEAAFRQRERDLAAWLERSVSNAVIATGGGMPTVCENLKRIGKVVYLDCTFETVIERLGKSGERAKRPLALADESALEALFLERVEIYRRALNIFVNADHTPMDTVSYIVAQTQ